MSSTQTEAIDFRQAKFFKSATNLKQCPPDEGFEIAFVGRSNAGKSSALNTITDQNGLAKTSKTPGHTQLINIFDLTETYRLIDLPGYGFAKVPKKTRAQLEEMISNYLSFRQSCIGLCLLMDIRHPLKDTDWSLLDELQDAPFKIHILLTKADKLSNGAQQQTLKQVRQQLKAFSEDQLSIQTFSALKKHGVKEARAVFSNWFLEKTNKSA